MREINRCIAAGLFFLGLLSGLTACSNAPTWQEQYDLGMKYLEEGNYEEALTAFDSAIEIDAKKAAAFVGHADTYMALAENISEHTDSTESANNEAEADADTDTTQDTDNTDGNEMSVGESQRMAQLLKVKKEENPDNLTGTEKKQEYYEKAVQDYETALDLDETLTDARRGKGKALFEEGKLLDEEEQKKKFDEALQEFEKVVETEDRESADYVSMGDIYASSGESAENFQKAEDCYQQASELDETNTDAYLGLADVRLRQKKYGEALDILEQGYEKTQNDAIQKKIDAMKGGVYTDQQGRNLRKNYLISGTLYYLLFQYGSGNHITHVAAYTGEGKLINEVELSCDENGRELVGFDVAREGDFCLIKESYEYDQNGRVTRYESETNGDILVNMHHYEGNIERNDIYHNGTFCGYDIYEYDSNGKIKKEESYEVDGSLFDTHIYEYDSDGKWEKFEIYGAKGEFWGTSETDYDNNGHHIKSSYYSKTGELENYQEMEWVGDLYIGYKSYDGSGELLASTTYEEI